ncbi:hypothetical protein [Arachidicoccus sp.]|uniref:hypothetical protein n=1 Tax=Arachidicoccus sp. TaxID=1872624 RepID=UPI003D1C56C0
MVRYLRADATSLSDEDIRDIINAKDLMNRASEIMARKYKISPWRVYQIWRGEHPPIAPILINNTSALPFTAGNLAVPAPAPKERPEGNSERPEGANNTAGNLAVSGGIEMIEIKDDELKAFYERETQRGQKNIERFTHDLSTH